MRFLLIFLLLACPSASAQATDKSAPPDLVDAATVIPSLVTEIRYAGADNFVGRRITGYDAPVCLLSRPAATALARVQKDLAPFGLGLMVFDCYRPTRAVADFVTWARDPADQKRKADYYPNVDKSRLFELGYIAERSGHSRGSTVDLTLIDLASKKELDMGAPYDLFDTLSWPNDPRPTFAQRSHRHALQAAMHIHGFRSLKEEWWHFTLRSEPYPNAYFDVPVAAPKSPPKPVDPPPAPTPASPAPVAPAGPTRS